MPALTVTSISKGKRFHTGDGAEFCVSGCMQSQIKARRSAEFWIRLLDHAPFPVCRSCRREMEKAWKECSSFKDHNPQEDSDV